MKREQPAIQKHDPTLLFCIGVLSIVAPMAGVLTAFVLLVQGKLAKAAWLAALSAAGIAAAL